MPTLGIRNEIKLSIQDFSKKPFSEAATGLLNTLGYTSEKRLQMSLETVDGFLIEFDKRHVFNKDKALAQDWKSIDLLFQITDEEVTNAISNQVSLFESKKVDDTIIQSYLFFTLELEKAQYSRTQLAQITREINKLFPMPAMVIFRHGDTITISIIARRLHKRDESRDVLDKVTLIKDISIRQPHRGHIEILNDLSIDNLAHKFAFTNFVELHRAWQETLDISELNKKFYKEIANWYFWAIKRVTFPEGAGEDVSNRNATSVIRLITRLIFVWFIKEKGLVPDELFEERTLRGLLNYEDPKGSTYYKAIVQNLFFATLNTEMGPGRKFRSENDQGRDGHYLITNVYRYKRYFKDPDKAIGHFSGIPFLNGGLFECLDKDVEQDGKRKVIRIDGFSDRDDNPICVPDILFFGGEQTVDLSEDYGDRRHAADKVCGLINIFNKYKFTIEENTPIEEEIALDPELLGKVFENLLASYNPETGTTARKQTGSFYTPREIVNYMVDEALITYLATKLDGAQSREDRLRHLVSYNNDAHKFNVNETNVLIEAINEIKVLDPACGSGAFPMGILHKLVYLLGKLDPQNERWLELQLKKAIGETEEAFKIGDQDERRHRLMDIEDAFENNASDYGRKLFLIENCIFGVDIQPIAVQISKLRFFISLVVDQVANSSKVNMGIRPLPNLESKFVAANTLVCIDKPQQMSLRNPQIEERERNLFEVRSRLFTAKTSTLKQKLRAYDKKIRQEIATLLEDDGWGNTTATQLASWDPYDQNLSSPFFDPEWMFGIGDGFQIVIGNPPYSIIGSDKKAYQKYYLEKFKMLSYKINTYIMFIEKGLTLLSENQDENILAFIIPKSLVFNTFYKKTREILLTNFAVDKIVEIQEKVFENVEVGDSILLFSRNSKNPGNNPLRYLKVAKVYPNFELISEFSSSQRDLLKLPDKHFVKPTVDIEQLITKCKPLNDIAEISNGLNPGNVRHVLISEKKETAKHQKLLLGRDIQRYLISWSGMWVNYDSNLRKTLTIDDIKSKEGMTAQNKVDFALRSPSIYLPHKILVRKTSDRIIAAYDAEGYYFESLTYSIKLKSSNHGSTLYLLGIMNSRLINFIHGELSQNKGKVFAKVLASNLRKLPIRIIDFSIAEEKDAHDKITNLVEKILQKKISGNVEDLTKMELEIDSIVYQLYGLSDIEIAEIEGRENLSSNTEVKLNDSVTPTSL